MTALLAWLSARNKALTALLVGAFNWGVFVTNHTTSPSGPITSGEWMLLAGIGLTAFGVHQITNSTPNPPPAEGI